MFCAKDKLQRNVLQDCNLLSLGDNMHSLILGSIMLVFLIIKTIAKSAVLKAIQTFHTVRNKKYIMFEVTA